MTSVRTPKRKGTVREQWVHGTAEFSPCMAYRYWLTRTLRPDPAGHRRGTRTVAFCMLNPSTATAEKDDPTIRRCIGYAQTWGYTNLIIVNAYAYRSTEAAALKRVADPVGPDNDEAITHAAERAEIVIAAWGTNATPERVGAVRRLLDQKAYVLRFTAKTGAAEHPLYLPKHLLPQPWRL